MIEMYLAGVSVRRVEDITEALWGTRVSPSTVSELNQKIYAQIDAWRNRPIEGEHPYVYLDGIWLKRSWGGEVKNVAVLVAIGVDSDGYREILGVCEGTKEDKESWRNFLRHLKERGLKGVRLVISDKCLGLVEALGEFLSRGAVAAVRGPLVSQRVHGRAEGEGEGGGGDAQGDPRPGGPRRRPAGRPRTWSEKLEAMKLGKAAADRAGGRGGDAQLHGVPAGALAQIRTNNPLERIMREIRRRTRVVGAFPDGRRR